MMRRSKLIAMFAAAIGAVTWTDTATAQNYPTKPIRWVLGPAPDVLPRLVSQKLAELWGQQVIVDQRPGAGGAIAAELVARASPDGYTWLMSTGAFYVHETLHPKLPYNMLRDIGQVTLMATIPFIAVVYPALPVKNLRDLVQLAKASPGKLNFASGGVGTTSHLVGELFKLAAKVDIVHVPYKSVPAAVGEVIAGQTQLTFSIAQGAVPHVQSGKLRALASTGAKRSPALPEVPTMSEAGYSDLEFVGWNGVSVPIETPRALLIKLNGDIRRVLALKEVQERMVAAGFDPADTTLDQFDAFVRKDVKLYQRIVRESKINID